MTAATLLYAVLAILAGGLATLAVWSPRRLLLKVVGVAAAAIFLVVGYAGVTELLSRPKPVSLEWAQRASEQAELLGAKTIEGSAIFLFLQLPGVAEPRSYRLPWSREAAEQLQKAQHEAAKRGGGVLVDRPFEQRGDEASLEVRAPMFYAPPPAGGPEKTAPARPLIYDRRS